MACQGSHRPGKILEFDICSGKLLEFHKTAIFPGISKNTLENEDLSSNFLKLKDFLVLRKYQENVIYLIKKSKKKKLLFS